jgi:hypothetical protein
MINRSNFYIASVGVFKEGFTPKEKPDYVSRTKDGAISSEYWFTEFFLIRRSNHWGQAAGCFWRLELNSPWLQFRPSRYIDALVTTDPYGNEVPTTGACRWSAMAWREKSEIPNLQGLVDYFERVGDINAVEQLKTQYGNG